MNDNILDKINARYDEIAKRYFSAEGHDNDNPKLEYKCNLLRPPGLVGEVTSYINSKSRYPRENLAVISALVSIGNIGGLFTRLENNDISPNLFAFCIAGSATGKEAVLQATNTLHIEAGISAAIHGSIKSEQEVVRNLISHQASFYIIDELGLFLRKLNMSHKSGGASYLQGIIGMLMAAYSKANGNLLLSGDVKKEIKVELTKEYTAIAKRADDGITGLEPRLTAITDMINDIDKGLPNPFLSMLGFSTPSTFNESVSFEQITSGFIGRSIIINEPDTNPKRKRGFIPGDMSESLREQLAALCITGSYNAQASRVESNGAFNTIRTPEEALDALDNAADWFEDEADKHVEQTGFEAVVRRGYEMVEKVSFILAMGGTERTTEHVEWAFEYIRRDIEYKTHLAYSNVKEKTDPVKSMKAKIICSLSPDGITVKRIAHKYSAKEELVKKALESLIADGKVYTEERTHKFKKQTSLFILAM